MTDLDDDQLLPFQLDLIALKRFGDRNNIRYLIWEKLAPPAIQSFRRDLQLHSGHYRGRGQRFRVRKSIQQNFYPEEMIAVGMGDIDCLQRLSARNNGIRQPIALRHRKEGVYEYRVLLSVDERRRIGHPHQGLL